MTTRRRSLIFVHLGHSYDHLFMLLFPTVVLALEDEFGRSYGELLTLSVWGFIAFGAGTLPAGWLGDRWSRRGMMLVFFLGIGASSVLTGLATSTVGIAVGLAMIGLFASIYHPIGTAMVVGGAAEPGRALGVNGVWGNMGVAAAALIAGALTDWVGWRAAFIVPGVIAVATGLVYAVTLRDGAERSVAAAPAAAPAPSRAAQVRAYIVLAVAALCGGVIFNAIIVAMPKIFDERLAGLVDTTFGVGGLVAIVYAVAAFTQIIVGRLIDRHALKPIFLALLLAQPPVFLLAAGAEGWPLLIAALAAMVLVFGEIPIHETIVARYTAGAWRSRAYALKYVLGLGVAALGVPLVAFVYQTSGGFAWLFVIYAGLALVIAATALLLLPGAPAPRPVTAAAAAE